MCERYGASTSRNSSGKRRATSPARDTKGGRSTVRPRHVRLRSSNCRSVPRRFSRNSTPALPGVQVSSFVLTVLRLALFDHVREKRGPLKTGDATYKEELCMNLKIIAGIIKINCDIWILIIISINYNIMISGGGREGARELDLIHLSRSINQSSRRENRAYHLWYSFSDKNNVCPI